LGDRINCRFARPKTHNLRKSLLERYGQPRRGNWRLGKFVFQLAAYCLLTQLPAMAAAKEVRRVLIVHSLGFSSPASVLVDTRIRAALENSPYQIELYEETLQNILFSDPASQQEVRQGYIHKYRDRRPDVIIAVGPAPIKFMVESHDEFGTNIPIVFCASTEEQVDYLKLDSHFTGAWRSVDPVRTLDAALHLRPDTRHVVVVGGVLPYDRRLETIVKERLNRYESRFEFIYLTNSEMPALLEQLQRLPEHTIILYTAISQDAAGTHFIDETQSLPMVVGVANAPVFVMEDTFVGQGTIGGYVTSYADEGRVAGGIAVRILKGEKPQNIPIVNDSDVYTFDWRALQRWGIQESGLPPGSVVLNREPTLWEANKRYFIGVVCLFFLETLFVLALVWQRAGRKKVEKSLVERLTFETLLSDLSTTFINLPEERVVSNLEEGLGRMGAFLQMDRITLYEFSQDRAEWAESFTWTKEGARAGRAVMKADQLPWWTERTLHGELLVISSLDELPDEAATERNFLRAKEIISAASVPLEVGGEVFGGMTFASTARRLLWSEDLVQRLKMLAEIFSNALGRKHAEARRRESEERFRLVANTAPVLIWMSGIEMSCTYLNQGWLDFTGRTLQDELGSGWEEGIYPLDLRRCKEIHRKAFENRERFTVEFRLRRHDGQFRWVLDIGVPRFNADGSFAGYIGSVIDVTDHKEAEQALATVSGRLIQAQEEERHRIARELHDDISQRLALLSVELQTLANDRPKSSVEFRERTEQLLKRTSQISSDIHALSHRLHSSKLDYMGAVAAMAGFCSEMTAQTGSEIEFVHTNVPKTLPQDISLCLFRVLQEGLRNAITYSGAQHFKVELGGTPGAILLVIRDSGAGFDPETAMKNGGLGLISMRERVSLVKGTISITSRPMVGTEIRVQIPFVQAQAACASQMSIPSVEEVYGTSEDKDLAGR
jgi:PAS domain S-box-containing protein